MPLQDFRTKLLAVVSLMIICSPAMVYLVDLTDFGQLQNNDYYGIVRLVTDGDSLSRDPGRWLSLKSNEHRATVPMVIYALNMVLTDGSNFGLTIYALLVLSAILALLYQLLPTDLRSDWGCRTLLGLTLGLLCYTPVAAHSVAMGFSGTQWFTSNLLAVAAIATLTSRADDARIASLWPLVLFGLLGTFTYSTSLLLWPALLIGALYLRIGFRRCLLIAATATAVYSLFVFSYEPLSYHPEPETRDFGTLAGYTAVFLGSLVTEDVSVAKWVGWCTILASLVAQIFAAVVFRSSRTEHAPWLMLQIYAFANALGTAISRSGFGEDQAMASRYASVAALFWVGLTVVLALLACRLFPTTTSGRIAAMVAIAILTAAFAVPMHRRGGPMVDSFAQRGSRQGVAALAIRHGIRDDQLLREVVTPAPNQIWAVLPLLQAIGHVPFDRPSELRVGERVEPELISRKRHSELQGRVEKAIPVSSDFIRLRGWAYSPSHEVVEVLLIDGQATIRGAFVGNIRRPDLQRELPPQALKAGWEGFALTALDHDDLEIYVRLSGDPIHYRLPMSKRVRRLLQSPS